MKRLTATVLAFLFLVSPIFCGAVSTSAKAAILINADTLEVIYSQNADEKLPMASTTKIMTGLLLCEFGNFDTEITVTAEMVAVEGSSMGLLAGDTVTLHDLLYGLMLSSGNDAANVIAYHLGGTVNGFVKQMNQKAKEIGLENTNFVTPSGLDANEHYTTAYDLAKLSAYALKNEDFAAAVSSKSATLNYGNPPYRRTLTNHNKLLKLYDDAIGVKTGYTKKSGRCLVSAAERDGMKIIAVTLCDPDDWDDHIALLDYGFSALKKVCISPEEDTYTVPVISGVKDEIKIEIEPYSAYFLDDADLEAVVNLPKFLYAPLAKGEKIGTVTYMKSGKAIAKSDILAPEDIAVAVPETDIKSKITENIRRIFQGIWEK